MMHMNIKCNNRKHYVNDLKLIYSTVLRSTDDKHQSSKNGKSLRVPSFDTPTKRKFSVSSHSREMSTPIFRFSTKIISAIFDLVQRLEFSWIQFYTNYYCTNSQINYKKKGCNRNCSICWLTN